MLSDPLPVRDTDDTREQRTSVTNGLRAVCPDLAFIDCARLTNVVVDARLLGDERPARALLAFFKALLDASDEAEADADVSAVIPTA